MSQKLLNHNSTLKRFVNEGLYISVVPPYLVINDIPYVNVDRTIGYGKIISQMVLSGNIVSRPSTHVVYFSGEFPCDQFGKPIERLRHQTINQILANIKVDYSFSNKNERWNTSEYEKVMNYLHIITGPVYEINPKVTPFTYHLPEITEIDPSYPFKYIDTNSSRNGTEEMNALFSDLKIGIIGLGGTGSYILDLVSKTQVKNIHLFDGDKFHTHNAFRAPGAASEEELNCNLFKTDYYKKKYEAMHNGIVSHSYMLEYDHLKELSEFNFVFIAIDANQSKKVIIEFLVDNSIPFIDSGISVNLENKNLTSTIRVNLVDKTNRETWESLIPLSGEEDIYQTNIQLAEVNNLAATFSVIMWKKYVNFYRTNKKQNLFYILEADELIT